MIFPTKLTEFPTKFTEFVPFIFIISQYCPTVKRILPDWLCLPNHLGGCPPPPYARYAHANHPLKTTHGSKYIKLISYSQSQRVCVWYGQRSDQTSKAWSKTWSSWHLMKNIVRWFRHPLFKIIIIFIK
jgi:hypothetical protein